MGMQNHNHRVLIPAVSVYTQHGIALHKFMITAAVLIKHARVDRFGESPTGIQRKLDQRHADDILEAMAQNPKLILIEPIFIHLEGKWFMEDGALCTDDPEAYMSIDDGGHRFAAMGALIASEQEAWVFDATAAMGLTMEDRMRIFRQQELRKEIDSRLNLAHAAFLGDWKDELARDCYALCKELNGSPISPLYRQVIMEEMVKRPMEGQHRPSGINVVGLMTTLRRVLGKHSTLRAYPMDKRQQLVIAYLSAAKEIWPRAWTSDTHVLQSARGIRAVLLLITNGTEFGRIVGTEPTLEKMRDALSLAKSYDWSARNNVNANEKQIMERLDQSIGRNLAKRLSASKPVAVAS